MNIIIVGAGEIGRHLAAELSREAHNITVIERTAKLVRDLEQSIDAKVVRGDGTCVQDLVDANVGACELFLALTSDNTVNLMSASMAKKMGVEKVISRVHPGLQREEWLFDFRGHFGIDHIFSSERLSALELAKSIRNPDSLTVEELARGKIEFQQIVISKRSTLVGQALRDIHMPEQTRVVTICRDDEDEVPHAGSIMEEGDVVTIVGEPRRLRDLALMLNPKLKKNNGARVVIFGGGEYGFSLAQMLEGWDCRVRIFERDGRRCRFLANFLQKTTVIHADATVVAELEEEQVGEADFFVAASESDEDNVMTCLQANNLGAKSCLTLIHRADYARAIGASGQHFGVVAAVSPREATLRDVERFITSDSYHVVKELGTGELIEVRISKKSKVKNQRVSEVGWPAGSVLVGVLRGLHAFVPGPSDELEAGDLVYAMVSPVGKKPFLRMVK